MAPASDSCAAGFCVTFDNSVNIVRTKGQFIEASKLSQKEKNRRSAIELDPRLADAWCNCGIAYNSIGDPDRAMADLSQALALHPRNVIAHFNRGVIFQSRGEVDLAVSQK
jgi:Tfp pilus assembly protein PilF